MNQILVTQKLYITPELKRKKKVYKLQFFLSVFLVCLFSSYYIYAEYDRSKSEEVSQEILSEIRFIEPAESRDNTTIKEDTIVIVAIDDGDTQIQTVEQEVVTQEDIRNSIINVSGVEYKTEAILNIPRLSINYPILSETSEELLKISLNKYWGPNPNTVGNYCIVGHNYKSKKMFGRLSEVVLGDIVELTDNYGDTLKYSVYDRYIVEPTDVRCTSQMTNGNKEITLITCANSGKQRLVVKAREIK